MTAILQNITMQLGIQQIQRHIFLCCDQTKPKCCNRETGLEAWDYLKKRLRELDLAATHGIFRSKVNCLQICHQGPIALVYPEGIWYHSCSPENLETIIQQHLLLNQPVESLIFCRHPLPAPIDIDSGST
ncbi:MAG: (2Fe-2S) ferredoxin domain-containing protein [Gammaproteobacteria bacterium]|nr:MAG: (2Fe-2S) ferredoxin domain-containing protein [Gammaproteobacteria bacterium]